MITMGQVGRMPVLWREAYGGQKELFQRIIQQRGVEFEQLAVSVDSFARSIIRFFLHVQLLVVCIINIIS